ncbi:DUF3236 domain-containing protein [uncultured Methanospirillum sp.]|uniref:DUF3236 domain-containing protein n=1 Tax=uncultured Methanospirillum sp. TaxID=262503 RepID=UPI0029C828BE|nr:DUF3236 domain-containing protein [uncultured Methanospirillum sp.]
MELEQIVENAYYESVTGVRTGDTKNECREIRRYIRDAEEIVIPNHNEEKVVAINEVLEEFGLSQAKHLQIHTDACDLSRMPAMTKAIMALDICSCDLVIARGRLGIPGSGSILVILDKKGRILTASLSPPHIVHGKPVSEAVRDEMTAALERIGFTRSRGKSE